MSFLSPLRADLFRYRRRKQQSLDGALAGVEYNRYHRGYNRSAFDNPLAIGPPRPADAYAPDPGDMEMPHVDYEPYEWEMPQRSTPLLRLPLPDAPEPQGPPEYNSCLMTDELFEQAMRESIGEPDIQEPLPCDHDVGAWEAVHDPDTLDDLVAAHTPSDPIQEIEHAFDQQLEQLAEQFAPEQPMPDPHQMEQQMYYDPFQQLLDPFGMWGPGPMM